MVKITVNGDANDEKLKPQELLIISHIFGLLSLALIANKTLDRSRQSSCSTTVMQTFDSSNQSVTLKKVFLDNVVSK